jgi:hypothetical protein
MKNWFDMLLRSPEGEGGSGGEGGEGGDVVVDTVLGGDADTAPKDTEQTAKPEGEDVLGDKPKDEAAPKEQTPEEKAAADAAAKDDAVPEGEYEFALPEGMELDATLAERAQPVLKELGLTQGQANKLAAMIAEVRASEGERIVENYVQTQQKYLQTAKTDPEIGNEHWAEKTAYANQALQKFGTPALTAALREHGVQNHPEFIRIFARIGAAHADDVPEPGQTVDTTEVPPEERWYGTTTKTKRG